MIMTHPGLPSAWAMAVLISAFVLTLWALVRAPQPTAHRSPVWSLARLPLVGPFFAYLTTHTWILLSLKVLFVAVFVVIITAGLWGTPIAERNLATALTWNLWWTGIIIAIVFSGSSWCAVCPWDTIASWLVKQRLWRRPTVDGSLQLHVPRGLRSVWPASLLFIGFSWLELGVGIVSSPYATALLALAMVVLATTALALFEGKAFCRYMCPVGRTVGAYSQLSAVALRPIDSAVCAGCTTLECYHGSQSIAPCPTRLVMGRLKENTYCTSCGNCTQSCPSQNISWQLRSPSTEAMEEARPHMDEAFFMLILLSLTLFHGLTMLPDWHSSMTALARMLNDSGQLLASFSLGLTFSLLIPVIVYSVLIQASVWFSHGVAAGPRSMAFRKQFAGFAFTCLPLAFAYHLAHNLNHFFREPSQWRQLLSNPLGTATLPLSMAEKHERAMTMLVPQNLLFTLQALLLALGFYIAMQVIRHRGYALFQASRLQLAPMLIFALLCTGTSVWLLVQPMTMRM